MSDQTKDIDQKLEEWAIPLRQMLEQEESALVDARAEVKRREARIKRIERTLRSMEPDATKPAKAKPKAQRDWRPNGEILTSVREAIADAPEGITSTEIIEVTSLSRASVDRALTVLRAEEEVRRAGKRGVAILWKSMGVSEHAVA